MPDLAHFVLEQLAQRLDQLEAHALGQAADVVVALDRRRRPDHRHALDHVGIERALGEEVELADVLGRVLEDVDELGADDLALLLGIGDAGEPRQEARRRVDDDQRQLHPVAEPILDLRPPRPRAAGRCRRRCRSADRRSPCAPAAPRPSSRRRPTGRRRRGPSPTSAWMRADRLVDERRHRPVAAAAADVDGEGPQQIGAVLRCARPRDGTAGRRAPRSRCSMADDRRGRAAWRRRRSPAARRRPSRRGWSRPSASAPGPSNSRPASPTVTSAWPNSRCDDRVSVPPRTCVMSCMP